MNARRLARAAALLVLLPVLAIGAALAAQPDLWWRPGAERTLSRESAYRGEEGDARLVHADGALRAKAHPFFIAMDNGRACVSCHQPADGMSLSLKTINERWRAAGARESLFATIDGADCPNKLRDEADSHRLLFTRGLVRIARPWPPRDASGAAIEPDFTIEVARDPAGCNTDAVFGLNSASPTISIYRRPRPVLNLDGFAGALTADRRTPTLAAQARDAALTHLQSTLSDERLALILSFETAMSNARGADAGESVRRGAALFAQPFRLPGGGEASCASCHDGRARGAAYDVGANVLPWARTDDLPVFKITCRAPHPRYGRVFYVTDPGVALTTGQCADVGAMTMPQFSALALRAPYFANGSARSLKEVIDYYDKRFALRFSEQDKRDLAAYLASR